MSYVADPPTRITVVCSGNICRSPMAEAVLRRLLQVAGRPDVVVTSGGIGGWHVGEGADRRTVRVLAAHGYDAGAHRARQFTAGWFAYHDLVLAADRGHRHALRRLAPSASEAAKVRLLREFDPVAVRQGQDEVADPYYGGSADFEQCLREVEAACRGVVRHVQGRGAFDEGERTGQPG